MKAWEIIKKITEEAVPVILSEEDQTWLLANEVETANDNYLKRLWHSNVPGSFAPESIMIAAVQSKESMGYMVFNGVALIEKGLQAIEDKNLVELNKITALLWYEINNATVVEDHSYWTFKNYTSFEEVEASVTFMKAKEVHGDLSGKYYSGWLAQIIGGAFGTAMEGYTTSNIEKKLGDVRQYIRKPNTFNDDITFEIAFLDAFKEKGSAITSHDVALAWVGLVPMGWSAEEIALRNIKYGIFPPESGTFSNPFSDWIGAQMRGAICGQLAPGNPKEAARLAWIDGVVSHSNNGVLGEMFNAMLVSLSFVEEDVRKILADVIDMIPSDSEYYQFTKKAYDLCIEHADWRKAWEIAQDYFKEYNWIHAYPNIMAQVFALYYGQGDFDETLHIIGMCGQDVDCNAAQIMTAVGTIVGSDNFSKQWTQDIGDTLDTYLRSMKKLSIKELAESTHQAYLKKETR